MAEIMVKGLKRQNKGKHLKWRFYLAGPTRLELATSGVTGETSGDIAAQTNCNKLTLGINPALRGIALSG